MRDVRTRFLLAVLAVLFFVAGCGPSDPVEQVLAERVRWSVTLQRWFPSGEGVFLSLRVQNPPDATLERLTVQVLFLDEGENTVDERWEPLAVGGLRSGRAEDVPLSIADPPADFDAVAVLLVTAPDDEQRARIVELGQS